jgi:TM2 domain-containing membrane protein YozV
MSASVCPYCRGPIEAATEEQLVCAGCGTPHHGDCYAENGGCTVFGCSAAPAEEPKLSLSGSDLVDLTPVGTVPRSTTLGLETRASAPSTLSPRTKTPPPPMPPGKDFEPVPVPPVVPRFGMGSILFAAPPVAAAVLPSARAGLDFEPDPEAKNRTTFIVLGVLLGPFGAHNFYAGYRRKAVAQGCITLLTLGFASPMTWIWAVIDVCTVDQDSKGIKFKS